MTIETSEKSFNSKSKKFIKKYFPAINKLNMSISLPGLQIEIPIEELLGSKTLDQRLQRLSTLKTDLQDSILAIEELENEANRKKLEVTKLDESIKQLTEDKTTTEIIVNSLAESFGRVLAKATKKSRWRGIVEGLITGLVTGFLFWLLSKPF